MNQKEIEKVIQWGIENFGEMVPTQKVYGRQLYKSVIDTDTNALEEIIKKAFSLTEKEENKQISELKKKIELLEIDEKTNLDDFEKLQNAHEKLRRQINCVKDHPEIKPLNCCWMADSLELRELRARGKMELRLPCKQETLGSNPSESIEE